MTDTNMTDTNYHHDGGGVPQDCGKRVRVKQHEENIVNRKAWARVCGFACVLLPWVVVWFRGLLCSV